MWVFLTRKETPVAKRSQWKPTKTIKGLEHGLIQVDRATYEKILRASNRSTGLVVQHQKKKYMSLPPVPPRWSVKPKRGLTVVADMRKLQEVQHELLKEHLMNQSNRAAEAADDAAARGDKRGENDAREIATLLVLVRRWVIKDQYWKPDQEKAEEVYHAFINGIEATRLLRIRERSLRAAANPEMASGKVYQGPVAADNPRLAAMKAVGSAPDLSDYAQMQAQVRKAIVEIRQYGLALTRDEAEAGKEEDKVDEARAMAESKQRNQKKK